jgi:hypothetical protein
MPKIDYKKRLLEKVPLSVVKSWLKRNPKPKTWQGDKYSWAYTEMCVIPFIGIAI